MGNIYSGTLNMKLHNLDYNLKDFLHKISKNEKNPPWDILGNHMNYSFYDHYRNNLVVNYYSEEKGEEIIKNMIRFLKPYIIPSKEPLGTIEHDINGYKKSYYCRGNEDYIHICPNCKNPLTRVLVEYKNVITYSNFIIDENLVMDEYSEELDDYVEYGESHLGDKVYCGICERELPEELALKILNINIDAGILTL